MPEDIRTLATAALAYAGPEAVLTSHTAAYLYGCHAADQSAVHVMMPRGRRVRRRPGVVRHYGVVQSRHIEILHGMRVLALDHTLAELLCREQSHTAYACLAQALALRPQDSRQSFLKLVSHAVKARADPRGKRRADILLMLATRVVTDRCLDTA